MNKRTYITLVLCLLVIIGCIIVYFLLQKRKQNTLPSLNSSDQDGPSNKYEDGSGRTYDPVLKRGSRGEDVKKLQRYLNSQLLVSGTQPLWNDIPLSSLVVDGIFGEKTEFICLWKFGRTSVKLSEIPDTL